MEFYSVFRIGDVFFVKNVVREIGYFEIALRIFRAKFVPVFSDFGSAKEKIDRAFIEIGEGDKPVKIRFSFAALLMGDRFTIAV